MIRTDIPQAPFIKEQLKKYLPERPLILEAGAHIGRDTIKLSKLWPQGHIYAFEPVPVLYKQLIENTHQLTNVTCYNSALSNKTGKALLYVSSGASTAVSSILEPYDYKKARPDVFFNPLEVQTITLDEWAVKEKVTHLDFLWLDMQGAELLVLENAHILSTVKAIYIEVSLTERFKGNPLYTTIFDWFEKRGFTAVQQDMPRHNKINILFIRNNNQT